MRPVGNPDRPRRDKRKRARTPVRTRPHLPGARLLLRDLRLRGPATLAHLLLHSALPDLDPTALGLRGLRQPHLEDAVLELGDGLRGVHRPRERERAPEGAVAPLPDVVAALLFALGALLALLT